MAESTAIQWTEATWNPWHGCHKISAGCDICYMFVEKKMYGQDGDVVLRSKTKFNDPLKWVRSGNPPKYCFTCSWSDFFINEADEWRDEAWSIIRQTPQINYQILTKRAGRIESSLPKDWGTGYPNVWLGVSVEKKDCTGRIGTLREIPAAIRFVSFEPLLADIGLVNLEGFHWAIVGGESGHKAREFDIHWFDSIREACAKYGTKLFMKQIGSRPTSGGIPVESKGKGGDMLYWPEYMKVREYPV